MSTMRTLCNGETSCECGCGKGGKHMSEKNTRAEVIAALVTDKYSGFRDGDEAILEAASDARLEEFRTAADTRKAAAGNFAKLETDYRNASARLKVAEDKLKSAEQSLTEEEFLEKAPTKYKEIIQEYKAAEASYRSSLISSLKDCGVFTEDQLKQKNTDELKTLAAYARVEVPDFSGRAVPKLKDAELNMNNVDFAPPDPYAAGIKALAGAK